MEQIVPILINGVISVLCAAISAWLASRNMARKAEISSKAHSAVTDEKIDNLTREVRECNDFAKRVPVLEEQIKSLRHRVDTLEYNQRRDTK